MDGGSRVLTSYGGRELETITRQNPQMQLGEYLILQNRQYTSYPGEGSFF